ncbi:MAG TPA: hydrogenobyrinic acid a,c-diamide synthase (glutamine-hydrolyzing) [Leucothrix mucor]|nr:hydrogenobyrinic acid a,c-diamide synthase (glutamine-hydrolyzing) [Leucothrix mucor]
MSRIYISAAHKSSGKTTLSIGLCAALNQTGLQVQSFKKGPDYIDPLWLGQASHGKCYNLDFNTMSNDEIFTKLNQHSQAADISIIEGNKGLYDGVMVDGRDSNAAVAKLLKTPVILVIDTRGVTRGVAPLLLGYQQFDKGINIAGVIFNMVGGARHEKKLRGVVEAYTDIPVLGAVHKHTDLELTERHLGLMPINESELANEKIMKIAALVSEQVDLEKILSIASTAPRLTNKVKVSSQTSNAKENVQGSLLRIGICKDSSFGFYYQDDLEALEAQGAELVSINTLKDEHLPPDLDGLFIGGGFPETHMEELSANSSLRQEIHDAIEAGLPTYAECGGLMYLSESLQWQGKTEPMVGVIPADTIMHKKPQGRGYVRLEETENMIWPNRSSSAIITAHEFHYSKLDNLKEKGKFAFKVLRGTGITGDEDGWVYKNLLASYAHMRDTERYHWAQRFVEFIRTCQ